MTQKQAKKLAEVRSIISDTLDLIVEQYGHNVPYSASMDGSFFPIILDVAENDDVNDSVISDLRFLAENGRILPDTLKSADMQEFKAYIDENLDEILENIESEIKSDL